MTPTWIAEEHVIFVEPDGRRNAGRIAVAQPVPIDDGDASCQVVLERDRTLTYPPMFGASTLQALLLGVQLLGYELHDFLERGGRVLGAEDGEDFPLDVLFGPLLRAPSSASPR